MPVKMKPASVIKARLGIQPNGPAHAFFTNTCFKHMTKFTPGGTSSHLNKNVTLKPDSIIYNSPDAHYMYMGELYEDPKYKKGAFYSPDYGFWSRPGITKVPTGIPLTYHTPGTGAFWDKKMQNSEGKEVVKEIQEYVNRGCK